MINLLLGAPGGGKSYEAVVFHILPALEKGRKVITNLPINVESFVAINPTFGDLIELRTESKGEGTRGTGPEARPWRAFEHESDFGDVWRRADGVGPLYVIDECHLSMPKGETRKPVEEWASLHRHENCDVLLITQSYGKISAAIRDLIQIVYRVRKNVAFGSMGSYTRKVQDGLRGEVVNSSIRRYEKRYFSLYRSHTKGRSAEELGASDITPIWKNWTFIGAAACAVILLSMLASGKVKAPWTSEHKPPTRNTGSAPPVSPPVPEKLQATPPRLATTPAPSDSASEATAGDPYAARGIHLTGYMEYQGRIVWSFSISQNGLAIASITDSELAKAGYTWKGESQCSGVLTFKNVNRSIICDSPQVGPSIPGAKMTQ